MDALQEHYDYLSDEVRLQRFEQAIAGAIRPGFSVADIGCGFGILGLLCLKAGASHVWGIDRTRAIHIARETMERLGLADRYTCINETSFEVELPQRVDVVVCDHVGCFGFDYGIIEALGDARRRFLKPAGIVIPRRVVLQVAAVQSEKCRRLARGWASHPVPPELHWLREYGVNTKHHHDFVAEEIASAPADIGTIDLREETPELLSFSACLNSERACELDGLGGWFACEIVDGTWMTNSPLARDQINRAQVFLPFSEPLAVIAGDSVEIKVLIRSADKLLSWSARVARTGQIARQSTWASMILDPRDRARSMERVACVAAANEASAR